MRYGPSTAKGASDEERSQLAREEETKKRAWIRIPTIIWAYPGFVAALELPMAS